MGVLEVWGALREKEAGEKSKEEERSYSNPGKNISGMNITVE